MTPLSQSSSKNIHENKEAALPLSFGENAKGGSLLDRIARAKLTKKQRKIAQYFIDHQEKISMYSTMEAAKEIGVSDASIIRFARAIGFEGFTDMKENLYDSLVQSSFAKLTLSERATKNKEKYGSDDLPGQFLRVMENNVDSIFRYNSQKKFEEVADCLVKAKKRYVIGMRGSMGIAYSFSRLLHFMLPDVERLTDSQCIHISTMQDIGPGDAVIMFVMNRYYKIDLQYLRMAKEKGAETCLVLNDLTGALTRYGDHIIRVSTENLDFFHSTIGPNFVSEYLLTLISQRVSYQKRLEEKDRMIADDLL